MSEPRLIRTKIVATYEGVTKWPDHYEGMTFEEALEYARGFDDGDYIELIAGGAEDNLKLEVEAHEVVQAATEREEV